uniref:Uncharacterized protein n=1 Tax=Anopheles melas TaxID=34690 RepID=A0A182TQH7_9DIPT
MELTDVQIDSYTATTTCKTKPANANRPAGGMIKIEPQKGVHVCCYGASFSRGRPCSGPATEQSLPYMAIGHRYHARPVLGNVPNPGKEAAPVCSYAVQLLDPVRGNAVVD